MTLMRLDPFREFAERFSAPTFSHSLDDSKPLVKDWKPLVDVTEDDKEYLIKAELPEVKKDDIQVHVDNGYLSFRGERKFEKEDSKLHRTERFYGSFERSFSLPENVEADNIEAEFKDGLLVLHLVKSTSPKNAPQQVEVK